MLTLKDLRGTAPDVASVLPRPEQNIATTVETVMPILEQVRTGGAEALLALSERFDGVRPRCGYRSRSWHRRWRSSTLRCVPRWMS